MHDLTCLSFAGQYSDYYGTLIKMCGINAATRDRSGIRNFANQVGFVNVTAKLVEFWFVKNLCAVNRVSSI